METNIESQILGHNFALVFDELYEKCNILELPFDPSFTKILEIAHLSNPAFTPDTLIAQLIRENREDNNTVQTVRKLKVAVLAEGILQNVTDYIQIDDNGGVRVRDAQEICGYINYIYNHMNIESVV